LGTRVTGPVSEFVLAYRSRYQLERTGIRSLASTFSSAEPTVEELVKAGHLGPKYQPASLSMLDSALNMEQTGVSELVGTAV